MLKHMLPTLRCRNGCSFSTTPIGCSKSKVKLVRKFLMKTGDKTRPKWNSSSFMLPSPTIMGGRQGKAKDTQRSKNLSKVFLDNITDIMSTGGVSEEVFGLGLEVSEVRFLPNMQGINIYWISNGTHDDKLEAILERHAGPIRHELSQLRILGHVPPITFVKDKRFFKLMEVDKMLKVADYGEDFVPIDPTFFNTAPTLSTALSAIEMETLVSLEENAKDPFEEAFKLAASNHLTFENHSLSIPKDLPAMRHDVLGVDTKKIYDKIHVSLKRARGDHRKGERTDVLDCSRVEATGDGAPSSTQDIRLWVNKYKQLRIKKLTNRSVEDTMLEEKDSISFESECEEEEDQEEEEDYMDDDFENEFSPLK